MKKSIFGAGLMFLGALLLIAPTRVPDGSSSSPTPVAAPSSPPPVGPTSSVAPAIASGEVAIDNIGDIIGTLLNNPAPVPGDPSKVTISVAPLSTSAGDTSTKLTQSGVYFPVYQGSPTPTPASVTLTVPATVLVAFCSSGSYYNKATGQCTDGKVPYKMVPTGSLSDPAAQTPTVVCRAPMVPTWNPAQKKWNCIVPAGFKNTLGN